MLNKQPTMTQIVECTENFVFYLVNEWKKKLEILLWLHRKNLKCSLFIRRTIINDFLFLSFFYFACYIVNNKKETVTTNGKTTSESHLMCYAKGEDEATEEKEDENLVNLSKKPMAIAWIFVLFLLLLLLPLLLAINDVI